MAKQLKKVFVTQKDLVFFRYLHAMKVSTYDKINRDVYSTYQPMSVANRIRKFEDNNLICGQRLRTLLRGTRTLTLTEKGFSFYVERGEEQRIELKSDSVLHDLHLVDIRHRFLKSNCTLSYYTENQIQTWGHFIKDGEISSLLDFNSDAVVEVQFSKEALLIPIEYEFHNKTSERYKKIMNTYYSSDDVLVIFFICESEQILNRLKKIELQFLKDDRPKFFYSLRDKFLNNDALEFENCRNERLIIDAKNK